MAISWTYLIAPKDLKDLFNIPNKSFDGILEKQWKNCKKVCNKCGYCRTLTNKVAQVYSNGGTGFEKCLPWESYAVKT